MDLGLPSGLKWAICNVGALSEIEPGFYFSWGDTEGHTKDSGYDFQATYTLKGLSEINENLSLEHDAAHVNMGGNWRMPTKEDFEELINNTVVTSTTINNVAGLKFTNKTDASKYIFLSKAGSIESYELWDFGNYALYWTSTYVSQEDAKCYSSHSGFAHDFPRNFARPIRAVCE